MGLLWPAQLVDMTVLIPVDYILTSSMNMCMRNARRVRNVSVACVRGDHEIFSVPVSVPPEFVDMSVVPVYNALSHTSYVSVRITIGFATRTPWLCQLFKAPYTRRVIP